MWWQWLAVGYILGSACERWMVKFATTVEPNFCPAYGARMNEEESDRPESLQERNADRRTD